MILMYLKNSMNSKNVLWNFLYRNSLGKHVTRNAQSGEVEYSKIEYKTIKSKVVTTEICQNMQYWTWTSQWCSKACSKECRVGWIFNYEIYLPWNTKYKRMLYGKQHWHCMFRGPSWEVEYFNKENKLSKVLRLKIFDELIMHQSR